MTRLFGVIFADQIDDPQAVVDAYIRQKTDAERAGDAESWPGQPNALELRAGTTLAPFVNPHHHLIRKYRG